MYKNAEDYRNIISRRFIVYRRINTMQKINLRSNILNYGMPVYDRLLVNY